MFAELQAKKNDSAGVGASMKNQGVKKNAPGSVTGAVKMAAKKHKITKKMGDPKAALEVQFQPLQAAQFRFLAPLPCTVLCTPGCCVFLPITASAARKGSHSLLIGIHPAYAC